jgi:aerobic-type carbon monoxide dehydrogenase small subunit (CoxS/CutS family)
MSKSRHKNKHRLKHRNKIISFNNDRLQCQYCDNGLITVFITRNKYGQIDFSGKITGETRRELCLRCKGSGLS